MNDAMYRWLKNRGYTGTLNDATFQALGGTAGKTINDLWLAYGIAQGFGQEQQSIQRRWAVISESTSTLTWNDAISTLPV